MLEAYLGEVLGLKEFQAKKDEVMERKTSLLEQCEQVQQAIQQELEVSQLAESIEDFSSQVRQGLEHADFTVRR